MATEAEFYYDPERADGPLLAEGATVGWLYLHHGVGPAKAIKATAMTDGEGHGFIATEGEWIDVTIVDDEADQ
ncbi:hypothetical protein CFH99_07860 [Nocardioides aromaticivorans]|uniref:DUF2283 domain-containing protein n=1 Tax=Nocardioides aromaticivorans TaxID=200618 RepID=A0ABX7PHW8_9ACTN|nr:hypothetical protein [Nocardioides aromaticivorans]QSR25536.1 hypothetical protein CFH99_07860 [Nocardioides aromaticivorans]